jgi:hypothetical protein
LFVVIATRYDGDRTTVAIIDWVNEKLSYGPLHLTDFSEISNPVVFVAPKHTPETAAAPLPGRDFSDLDEVMKRQFRRLDADEDGFLTKPDLVKLFANDKKHTLDLFFAKADIAPKDNKLSESEFVRGQFD